MTRPLATALAGLVAVLALGCEARTTTPTVPPDSQATRRTVCPPDHGATVDGRCLPVEEAYVGEGGTTYWVANGNPRADGAPDGSRERPWRTITEALRVARPGDAVVIRAGEYRESLAPRVGGTGPGARITLAAYPGEEVVIAGTEELRGWRREGDTFAHAWPGEPLPLYAPEADPVFRREVVGLGHGAGMRVLTPLAPGEPFRPGTFLVEGPPDRPRRIVVKLPYGEPSSFTTLWMARPARLFAPRGADPYLPCGHPATPGWFRLVGLTFRVASNYAQEGAVCAGSAGSRLEGVTVEWTNGVGLDASGRGHVLLDVRANHNGQLGIGGGCVRCVFDGGEVAGNNWKGYDPLWEAGGVKLMRTRETVVRRLHVYDNDGPGLWLDTDNARNTLECNRVERNAVAGIMLEYATTETLVQHNVVLDTRFRGYSGAGILSQAASHNLLLHNTILGNEGDGIWLRLDPDRRAPDGHTGVFHNVVAGNAWTATQEGREVSIEGESLGHARTHDLDGNRYGRHATSDGCTSTFFFVPDPDDEAGFRGDDLARWRWLTGGEAHSALIPASGRAERAAEVGEAVPLPERWRHVGAPGTRPQPHARPGADEAG